MAPSILDDGYPPTTSTSRAAVIPSVNKRRTLTDENNHHQPLLPGLPDHIAHICISHVPPSILYSVCHSWRRVIYTSSFPPFLSLYSLSSSHDSTLKLSSFDPISNEWKAVTLTPPQLRRVSFRHPSFIARNLPVQSYSLAGNLVLLAGTSGDLLPAVSHPLVFNPLSNTWASGPPLTNPRRWCAAGVSRASVVVASGIGSHFTQTVSRSVEKWVYPESNLFDKKSEISNGVWKKMKSLSNSKFSMEAIDAIGCKDKLYMVNGKGAYGKEGVVYDVNSDEWSEMPADILGGWRGPAAAMDEKIIYIVDESKGVLRKYDDVMKLWVDVLENEMLKGAEHIAAGGGRVCVVRGGGVGIVVVDVVASPPRLLVVDTPAGEQVLRLHILPRMCSPEVDSQIVV
uniref:F-box/kelch-repeat protein SKIP25-like n=1 Tax=Erigeron canadensis TaxID=72917 RepID=UPI001CB983CB|nr:F-box/kelch-repeat protein SKIP25-like [Erigeron canadensis]